MDNRTYTLKELSDELMISIRVLRMYIRMGTLAASKVGRSYKVTSVDLDDFLETGVVLSKFGVGRG